MTRPREDSMDDPIIVTGLGRSGTTWMQWLLSQHPRIHISGQMPQLPFDVFWELYQKLARQGEWAGGSNRNVGYDIKHYAGSPPDCTRLVVRRLCRDYLTGFDPVKRRWGLKFLGACEDPQAVERIEALWPETRWVVCIRDPFRIIASARNTFVRDADPAVWLKRWIATCKFAESHAPQRVAVVQMDKLESETPQRRHGLLNDVLAMIGEEPDPATEAFIERWPIVHKVMADTRRTWNFTPEMKKKAIDEIPSLKSYLCKMGYTSTVS